VATNGTTLEPLLSSTQSFMETDESVAGVAPRFVTCKNCCTWVAPQDVVITCTCRSACAQVGSVVTGTWLMPLPGSQLSVVQALLSSTLTGLPEWQRPVWQVSGAVQALPSLQVVPSGAAGLLHVPVDVLHVPAA
jgi:hypothetical protein